MRRRPNHKAAASVETWCDGVRPMRGRLEKAPSRREEEGWSRQKKRQGRNDTGEVRRKVLADLAAGWMILERRDLPRNIVRKKTKLHPGDGYVSGLALHYVHQDTCRKRQARQDLLERRSETEEIRLSENL